MASALRLHWAAWGFGLGRESMRILSSGWQTQWHFLCLPGEEFGTLDTELAGPVIPSKLKVESGLEPRPPNSSL